MTARYLLDANVLIALTVAEHEHHDRASTWLADVDRFAVCPISEGALIRFLVRLGDSAESAVAVLRGVRASPRCTFWPDGMSYADVDVSSVLGHRQVTDTYLVALAADRGALLATLDHGLAARHAGRCLLLPA